MRKKCQINNTVGKYKKRMIICFIYEVSVMGIEELRITICKSIKMHFSHYSAEASITDNTPSV
jgi:hypothetical protein